MGDAGFAGRELVSQIGGAVQLVGGGITRGLAQAFERQGHGAQVGVFVGGHVLLKPATKFNIVFSGGAQDVGHLVRVVRTADVHRRRHK